MDILKHNGNILRYNGAPIYWEGGGVYPTDYLAFYKFEDNLNDETGNFNAVETGYTPSYINGKINKALNARSSGESGVGKSLVTGMTETGNLGTTWSIAGWFLATAGLSVQQPVFGNDSTGTRRTVSLLIAEALLSIYVYTGTWAYSSISHDFRDGSWHFYVYTRNGTSYNLYVDNDAYTSSLSATPVSNSNNIVLQQNREGDGYGLSLDSTMFFNRVLSSIEREQLWNGGAGV